MKAVRNCCARRGWFAALCLLAACHAKSPAPTVAPVAADAAVGHESSEPVEMASAEDEQAQLVVRLEPQLSAAAVVVHVSMLTQSQRWVLSEPASQAWSVLDLRDAQGDLPYEIEAQASRILSLSRSPQGRVHFSYRLEAPPPAQDGPPNLRMFIDPSKGMMHADGEAILWLPDEHTPVSCRVEVQAPQQGVATSLGLDGDAVHELTTSALRRINVLVGPLQTARFRLPDAHDDIAALGSTSFDVRWVAAETAGVRSSIGEYVGAHDATRFTTLIVSNLRPPAGVPLSVELRTHSLVIDNAFAPWTGRARMAVASALAHRWLGGHVRIDMGGAPGEGVWFTQGFSRHVAREVLFTLGLLTDEDMITELEALESVIATSSLADMDNAQVVAAGTPQAVALVTTRGALYAARLASKIATYTRREQTLGELLATLVHDVAQTGPNAPLARWEQHIAASAGAAEVAAFRAMILEGAPIEVPADAFGPCFKPTRGRYVPFELGFVDPGFEGSPIVVEEVDPQGPAHHAGLRAGDTLVDVVYRPGDPSVSAVLVIERDGARLVRDYLPQGKPVAGRRWIRDRRVPEAACVR